MLKFYDTCFDVLGAGCDVLGVGWEGCRIGSAVFSASVVVYGVRLSVFGANVAVFGLCSESFGAGLKVFGARSESFGAGLKVFGARSKVFNARSVVFFRGDSVWGYGLKGVKLLGGVGICMVLLR